MTTGEVANRLVELFRAGRAMEAVETLYAENVVSVEAMDFLGLGREMVGRALVLEKNRNWFADNQVHTAQATGPFVSPERFAVKYDFDWTRRATGERVRMSEVGVYTVEVGKIVREEFLYASAD